MINIHFENTEEFILNKDYFVWFEFIVKNENKKMGSINYIFCDDEYLLEINRTYLNHNYYTDIITFDYVKGNSINGDIYISLPRVHENAKIHKTSNREELDRVLSHGLLHLCGYKDHEEEEKKIMRNKENYYILLFKNSMFHVQHFLDNKQ
ncbi:MAG: rRNA maturation RNase YbeY [Bergeyella sp.]|nr:rRNA maturation RNase YbeY [Bergeyella sp.]